MELESTISCHLDIRISFKHRHNRLRLEDIAEACIRLEGQDGEEIFIDVTESVVKCKEAVLAIESIGLDVVNEDEYYKAKKEDRQFKSSKGS
ncbi:hypothetical protein D3C87_125210 [compost metagenome]